MSDLEPFNHGEEETHYCCNKRLEKEGGKAHCCVCSPHVGCDFEKELISDAKDSD